MRRKKRERGKQEDRRRGGVDNRMWWSFPRLYNWEDKGEYDFQDSAINTPRHFIFFLSLD